MLKSQVYNESQSNQEEMTWISQFQKGHEEERQQAFEAIYDRYNNSVYSLAYRYMGNAEDAFDVTQDTFIRAYQALSKKEAGQMRLGSWLRRIAANRCIDLLRQRKQTVPVVHNGLDILNEDAELSWWDATRQNSQATNQPEQLLLRQQTGQQIQQVLGHMKDRYRLALILRDYQGLSYDEVANTLGITKTALKILLYRAREQFRQLYAAEEQRQVEAAAQVQAKGKLTSAPARRNQPLFSPVW